MHFKFPVELVKYLRLRVALSQPGPSCSKHR